VRIAKSEQSRDEHLEVLADHSTDVRVTILALRWGSDVQATHCRKGEARHNVLLQGTTGRTLTPKAAPIFAFANLV
jgi:hypothetical protein